MRFLNNINIWTLMTALIVIGTGCERDPSDDVEPATFSKAGEIFTDAFVGLGADFYFPFLGAKPDVFSVDENEGYESDASIRIDVPNANDPAGGFAGANFIIDGAGRNLTEFDALTFWARSSQAATVGLFGFGEEFSANLPSVDLTTQWQQYIIPFPDPSRLEEVRTVFRFAAGGIGDVEGEEVGYTFWIDELKFEKLGTIAQPRPGMLADQDITTDTFIGQEFQLFPFTQTLNLPNGENATTLISANYFTFNSSNPEVASVNESGIVSINEIGSATITALLNNVRAEGSLTVNVSGSFVTAPVPDRNPNSVISVFSDAYDGLPNLNVAAFNGPGFEGPISISEPNFNGDVVIEYLNLDFVGIGWEGSIDVSTYDSLHIDIQVTETLIASDVLTIELIDFGANGIDDGAPENRIDDTGGGFTIPASELQEGAWISIDIPVDGFTLATGGGFAGSPNLNNIARVVFVGNGGVSNILVNNIYFYRAQ